MDAPKRILIRDKDGNFVDGRRPPERTLSERIRAEADSGRMGRRQKRMLHEWADEVAALEQERDELQKLLFVDRDEWRRFRVHGDTVLALESTAAQLARLREELEREIGFADRFQNDAARLREAVQRVLAEYDKAGLSNIGAAVALRRALAEEEE